MHGATWLVCSGGGAVVLVATKVPRSTHNYAPQIHVIVLIGESIINAYCI